MPSSLPAPKSSTANSSATTNVSLKPRAPGEASGTGNSPSRLPRCAIWDSRRIDIASPRALALRVPVAPCAGAQRATRHRVLQTASRPRNASSPRDEAAGSTLTNDARGRRGLVQHASYAPAGRRSFDQRPRLRAGRPPRVQFSAARLTPGGGRLGQDDCPCLLHSTGAPSLVCDRAVWAH